MKSFDEAARSYESFGFIQREMAEWLAGWIPREREGTALEIAAGTGFFTKHLLPWKGELLATDASAAMVSLGSAKQPQANWEVARAKELPDVSVDWIFSSSFLQWAQEPNEWLRHWKSRLRPGGHIVSGLFAAPTLAELNQILPGNAPLPWRTADEWKQIILDAGLQLVRAEDWERAFTFRSGIELIRTLHGVGAAPVRRLSGPSLRKAIRRYDSQFGDQNGVRSTWTFFRFEARRSAITDIKADTFP